ncbi:T9SS type A sorting domain-containing protein [Rhodohalobacter sp. 8-1]|uniref:T9SS type A sorting domain-containing protein n=1 Tax=Rhodohalobacter sp. 8-1 TaxID=3131972 RepID=UPI0030EBADC2
MKKYMALIVLTLFLIVNVFSQSVSTDGFINYSEGNKWMYESRNSDKELIIEIKDCTETDTLNTCQVENFGDLIVQEDSVFATDFFADAGASGNVGVIKYYLANHPIDSTWNACWDCYGYGSEAVIFDTTRYDVFGEEVAVKHIAIKEFLEEDDSLGNPVVQLEIAEKYGILSIQYYEGDALVLTGAVIEGQVFGNLIVSNERDIPVEEVRNFFLSSPYPNPFNPTTTISYQMEQPGQVTINLYTITGQLVKELLNTYNTSGTYSFQLNGGNLSSGMYILRGRLGEQTESRTITLIK